ncbi:26S proteasome subunit RPN7-domain-containing protein, partial [Pyronema omphalodes]
MSSPDPATAFFDARAAANNIVVTGTPHFDLETYISNYSGRTQIDRLLHIGQHSVVLSVEALKFAIKYLKNSQDVHKYKQATTILKKIAPNDPDAKVDADWVSRTAHKVEMETATMEAALKSYKHNLIKESIRMGHDDLGGHYYACGDMQNAFKSYSRMRDYCTAPKHILEMSMHIIRVAVEQGNYMAVQTQIGKIKAIQKTPEEELLLAPKLAAAAGLSHLWSGQYQQAAKAFVDCPATLGSTFNEVISSNDVAVYGSLCALASMDRHQIKSQVLDNNNFRNFLELEPHMRRAISYFYNGKYSDCLQILEDYKNDYLLDIHLQRHVKPLYQSIRSKSIVQYFIPFSCVTLPSMSTAFVVPEDQLEQELVGMIKQGVIQARIDTKNRLLVAKETDLRSTVHREALAMAQNYERSTRMKIVRANLIRAGLDIKGPKNPVATSGDVPSNVMGVPGHVLG